MAYAYRSARHFAVLAASVFGPRERLDCKLARLRSDCRGPVFCFHTASAKTGTVNPPLKATLVEVPRQPEATCLNYHAVTDAPRHALPDNKRLAHLQR